LRNKGNTLNRGFFLAFISVQDIQEHFIVAIYDRIAKAAYR